MSDKMTVYLIYVIGNVTLSFYDNEDKISLYGITNDKELYQLFTMQRNMKVFRVQKSKMTKKEYAECINQNYTCYLQLCKVSTIVDKYNDWGMVDIDMALTASEKDYLDSFIDGDYLGIQSVLFNDAIFNDKVKKVLSDLQFHNFYLLFNNAVDDEDDPPWDSFNIAYDELAILIREYPNLFK